MKRASLKTALAIVLVASLAVPATALAVPGSGRLGRSKRPVDAAKQARIDARKAALQARIERVLQNRGRGFDAAAAAILAKADRVSTLASKVESAGADVSAVRVSIEKARSLVADAKAAELAAADMFKAVPDAADKRAAFVAAKAQARVARQTLVQARQALRKAILDLRAIVDGLEGSQP